MPKNVQIAKKTADNSLQPATGPGAEPRAERPDSPGPALFMPGPAYSA